MNAAELRAMVAGLSDAALDDIISGRRRLDVPPEFDLAVWNAAIDEERDR